jgi:hypothetical protein
MAEEVKEYISSWNDNTETKLPSTKLLNKKRKISTELKKPIPTQETEIQISDAADLTDDQKRKSKS